MNDQKKNIVICDIDGTVANNDHRQHYLEGKKDWVGFFSDLINDKPIHQVIKKVKDLESKGKKIIFLSGRPEKTRKETIKWLKRYFFFDFDLLMRADGDRRNKIEVKTEIFEKNLLEHNIEIIFENDEELINLWRQFDLEVFEVDAEFS